MTTKHRMSGSPEWRAWRNARARCHVPGHQAFKNYGGRGIFVCEEWRSLAGGFDRFFAYLGARPSDAHTLERIDNERGYEPGNVRWALWREQMNNKRSSRCLRVGDIVLTVSQWAERVGLSAALISYRIKAGWPTEAVLLPADYKQHGPKDRNVARRKRLTIDGVTRTLDEWSAESPVSIVAIRGRLARGWDHKSAVREPLHQIPRSRS